MAFFCKRKTSKSKRKNVAVKAASIMKKYFGAAIGRGDAHVEIIKQRNGGN